MASEDDAPDEQEAVLPPSGKLPEGSAVDSTFGALRRRPFPSASELGRDPGRVASDLSIVGTDSESDLPPPGDDEPSSPSGVGASARDLRWSDPGTEPPPPPSARSAFGAGAGAARAAEPKVGSGALAAAFGKPAGAPVQPPKAPPKGKTLLMGAMEPPPDGAAPTTGQRSTNKGLFPAAKAAVAARPPGSPAGAFGGASKGALGAFGGGAAKPKGGSGGGEASKAAAGAFGGGAGEASKASGGGEGRAAAPTSALASAFLGRPAVSEEAPRAASPAAVALPSAASMSIDSITGEEPTATTPREYREAQAAKGDAGTAEGAAAPPPKPASLAALAGPPAAAPSAGLPPRAANPNFAKTMMGAGPGGAPMAKTMLGAGAAPPAPPAAAPFAKTMLGAGAAPPAPPAAAPFAKTMLGAGAAPPDPPAAAPFAKTMLGTGPAGAGMPPPAPPGRVPKKTLLGVMATPPVAPSPPVPPAPPPPSQEAPPEVELPPELDLPPELTAPMEAHASPPANEPGPLDSSEAPTSVASRALVEQALAARDADLDELETRGEETRRIVTEPPADARRSDAEVSDAVSSPSSSEPTQESHLAAEGFGDLPIAPVPAPAPVQDLGGGPYRPPAGHPGASPHAAHPGAVPQVAQPQAPQNQQPQLAQAARARPSRGSSIARTLAYATLAVALLSVVGVGGFIAARRAGVDLSALGIPESTGGEIASLEPQPPPAEQPPAEPPPAEGETVIQPPATTAGSQPSAPTEPPAELPAPEAEPAAPEVAPTEAPAAPAEAPAVPAEPAPVAEAAAAEPAPAEVPPPEPAPVQPPEPTPPPAEEPEETEPEAAPQAGGGDTSEALVDRARNAPAALAESLYRRALELDPQNHYAMIGLAEILLARGDAQEALPLVERAVRRRSRRAPYRVLLGDVRRALGDQAGAQEAYGVALEYDPENREARRRLGQ